MQTSIRRHNLAVQRLALSRLFQTSTSRITRSQLVWEGELTPSALSRAYRVRIRYKLRSSPRVEVVSPKLERRDGKRCEHMYSDDEPCVYLPRAREWQGDMLLAETIVPWTCEWLIHYELWLATGKWHGRGVHPGPAELSRGAQVPESD